MPSAACDITPAGRALARFLYPDAEIQGDGNYAVVYDERRFSPRCVTLFTTEEAARLELQTGYGGRTYTRLRWPGERR